MSNHTTTHEKLNTDSTPRLTDYMDEGKCFLESCKAYLDALKKERDDDGSGYHSYQELDLLKNLLKLLRLPEQDIDPTMAAIWLPNSYPEKEKRYRNYLLWSAFTNGGRNRESRRPTLSEKALLRALRSGHNEFECKHHIFNLLVSAGFPKKQACILAKYLGNRIPNQPH